jgi:hypothetical protein
MRNAKEPITRCWSERGLINELFRDLEAPASFHRWQSFVEKLEFLSSPTWGVITSAFAIPEPEYGKRHGFGAPDAIARIRFGEDTTPPHVFIFHGKLEDYKTSCKKSSSRSKLCLQLERSHRLAIAFASYEPGKRLIEPSWVKNTPYQGQRSVRDVDILSTIVEPFSRFPDKHYWHVSITSDESNPFNPSMAHSHQDYWPRVFLKAGQDNVWGTERDRFGWISWQKLYSLGKTWKTDGGPEPRFITCCQFNKCKLPSIFDPISTIPNAVTPGP